MAMLTSDLLRFVRSRRVALGVAFGLVVSLPGCGDDVDHAAEAREACDRYLQAVCAYVIECSAWEIGILECVAQVRASVRQKGEQFLCDIVTCHNANLVDGCEADLYQSTCAYDVEGDLLFPACGDDEARMFSNTWCE